LLYTVFFGLDKRMEIYILMSLNLGVM